MLYRRSAPLHLGADNRNVVRHVGRLLDGVRNPCAELSKDGDLILLIERILELRGRDTVRVTKVKGHAGEDMVQGGASSLEIVAPSSWAESAAHGAGNMLGLTLRACSWVGVCLIMLRCGYLKILDVWTDGSRVLDEVSGASSSGSGF